MLQEAEALATALDDPSRLGQVSLGLSTLFYLRGAYDQAITAAQRALALGTAGGDDALHASANQALGWAYEAQGDYCQAIDCLGQAAVFFDGTRRFERFGQSSTLPAVNSCACLARCHAQLGAFAEGIVFGDEGLRTAEAVAHPASLLFASCSIGSLFLRQGDLTRVLPLLERAVGICHEVDLPFYFPWVAATLSEAYTLCRRVADALPLLARAMEQSTMMASVHFETFFSLPLGEAYSLAGCLEEADTIAKQTLALAHRYQQRGN